MADGSLTHVAESKLTRFEIIPREALRASLEIFQAVIPRQFGLFTSERSRVEDLEACAASLLHDIIYEWPLTLEAGSKLARQVEEILSEAKLLLYKIDDMAFRLIVGKYFPALPAFYTDAVDVSAVGHLKGGDVLVLNQQLSLPWKLQTERRSGESTCSKKKLRKLKANTTKYKDPDLMSGECSVEFEKIVWAATVKSQLFPHECARDEKWRERRRAAFNEIPLQLKDTITVYRDRDSILKELDASVGLVDDAKKNEKDLTDKASHLSINESEVSEAILTPAETRSSSPPPDECSPGPDVSGNASLKLSYVAILESCSEKVSVAINPGRVEGPEMKSLDATKELWEFMANKGCANKIGLKEVFELAKNMITMGDAGPGN